ncbi:MAG: hypothetical protein ACTJF0_04630 [Psychroflexus halocasei]
MKFYLKFKLIFIAFISICFLSCTESENLTDETITYEKNKNGELAEAIDLMQKKGIINSAFIDKDNVTITYPDNSVFTFDISYKQQIEVFDLKQQQFISIKFDKNDDKYNLNSVVPFFNPNHEGQDFCQCYDQDVDEFCDGVVGCVALLHPLVQAVIVVHCVIETGTTECVN